SQISQNLVSHHYLEKLLIQLLGHSEIEIRDQAIVLLNMLYDGVDWQFSEAFVPKVVCVGNAFALSETVASREPLDEAVIMLSAPSYFFDCPLTWHSVKVKKGINKDEYVVDMKFKKFWRCGFYDWKVVSIGEGGKTEMLKLAVRDPNPNSNRIFAQGRFIVQPRDTADQQIHELMVDYKESDTDPDRDFHTLSKEIADYAKQGITGLYLMGVLERDNGLLYDESDGTIREVQRPQASPLAITDRSCPNKMLGGERAYALVMDEARRAGIKVLVDCLSRVSSSRPHRRYRKVLLRTLDADGKVILCYGTDGRAIKYEDTALLNYRKLKSWNLLVEDIISFARRYRIEGVHLDNGQAWPQIMELDEAEMYRKDTDGKPAYREKDILNGEIVIKNENHGYWNSTNVDTYANPMFVKLCRQLWQEFPEFYLIGECWGGYPFENRQGILARSGVIPRLFKLPIAIASLFGKRLQKDGAVNPCHPQTVNAIKTWYEQNRKFLPEGAYLVQSSSSHSWPYPAHLYGRGTWSAVDLLFFMPDIPMTFMDEIKGSVYRRNTTNVYQARALPKKQLQRAKSQLRVAMEEHESDEEPETQAAEQKPAQAAQEEPKKILRVRSSSSISAISSSREAKKKEEEVVKQVGPEFGFDLKKIHLHYEHRRKLRKERAVLRHGELVPLDAKHSEGWHSHVLAFARFSHYETAIIAINFTDSQVSFYIDFSNLMPYFEKAYHINTVAIFSDWIVEKDKEYYFLMELIKEKMEFTLPPFGSVCKGIQICKDDPMVYAMSIEKSFLRLNSKLIADRDCSGSQLCVQLLSCVMQEKPVDYFAMVLANLYKNYTASHKINMHNLLLHLHVLEENQLMGARLSAYCYRILACKGKAPGVESMAAYRAADEMITSNKLGPIA
ncbi:MAG: alpha-amylase family protein, partial [Acidobacteriaceae bacterium]|nr:alpha-amylase family protein [Acidobacteriaceae bacterium]